MWRPAGQVDGITIAILSGVAAWFFFVTPKNSFALAWPGFCFALRPQYSCSLSTPSTGQSIGWGNERDRVEVLFRELQHRVANNMAFIASLMRLQRRAVEARPETGVAVIDDAERRLQTMARIHRRLYDPEIANQPLSTYLEGLVKDMLEASGAVNIVCVVEVPPVTFDLSRLVTLSLLINELITNAVKHGFDDGRSGTISIRLDREAQNYVLSVADNGRGFAEETSGAATATLGLTIIRSLVSQLGAR
jgi:two-component sensor histidine kinase